VLKIWPFFGAESDILVGDFANDYSLEAESKHNTIEPLTSGGAYSSSESSCLSTK
jgi:hypothetical protein